MSGLSACEQMWPAVHRVCQMFLKGSEFSLHVCCQNLSPWKLRLCHGVLNSGTVTRNESLKSYTTAELCEMVLYYCYNIVKLKQYLMQIPVQWSQHSGYLIHIYYRRYIQFSSPCNWQCCFYCAAMNEGTWITTPFHKHRERIWLKQYWLSFSNWVSCFLTCAMKFMYCA